jgi:hypothetical protein
MHDPDSEQVVNFRLDLFLDTVTLCDNDAYEPNDNQFQATVLTDMTFTSSGNDWILELIGLESCRPGPSDWYALDIDQGDALSFLVRFSGADGDIDAFLYDPDLATLDSGESSSDDEVLMFPTGAAPATGRYFVEVLMYTADTASSYDLVVTSDRPFP